MEIQGRIIQLLPLQSGVGQQSGKAWSKQDYILETLDQYPKKVCFNLWGDRIQQFNLQEGEEVTVQIDIESREFNGRWYTDVRAWRVDRGLVSLSDNQPMHMGAQGGTTYASPSHTITPQPTNNPIEQIASAPKAAEGFVAAEGGDDLPF